LDKIRKQFWNKVWNQFRGQVEDQVHHTKGDNE
jgi:hypothetical protein